MAETVAINPALAISGIELINQWYHRPDYYAIMADCSNVDIGVWSENLIDRTVVVAVYGKGDGAPPVPSGIRDFGQVHALDALAARSRAGPAVWGRAASSWRS